jgi:hypothetical protein
MTHNISIQTTTTSGFLRGPSPSFFNKGNILISRRYQLHTASVTPQYPNGGMDAHIKKETKNRIPTTMF